MLYNIFIRTLFKLYVSFISHNLLMLNTLDNVLIIILSMQVLLLDIFDVVFGTVDSI